MASIRLLRGLLFAACLPSLARAQCGTPKACSSVGIGTQTLSWSLIGSPTVSQLTCVSWAALSGLGPNYNHYSDGHCYVQNCFSAVTPYNGCITGFVSLCSRFSTCTKAFPPKLLGKCPSGSKPMAKGALMACCCSSAPYPLVDSKLVFQGCLKSTPWH